jgi:indole-3-glycerol phosphate synthase
VPTFLETVVERTLADLEARRRATPARALAERLPPPRRERPFSEALARPGMSLIAEMKRASPSRGPIRPDASVAEIVTAYEDAGARASSVLTERHWFGGALDDLVQARAACGLPLLRKDFLVDEYQLVEARVAGADAILLIVAALEPGRLVAMIEAADALGLDALVEVHDAGELTVAAGAGARIIGINNRNLHTLEVDLRTTFDLLEGMPGGALAVAESGITTRGDVRALEEAGLDAILVGEALMRAPDPRDAVDALLRG